MTDKREREKTRIEKVLEVIEYHKWYRYCKKMGLNILRLKIVC